MLEIIELEISNHHKQGLWRRSRAFHTLKVKLAPLTLTLTASLISWRLEMRAKNFVVNRGVSCFIRGVSCFIRGVSCFIRGVSCFIRCILSCFIRCNPVFQSWSSRRERVKTGFLTPNENFVANILEFSDLMPSMLRSWVYQGQVPV